ncbi:hypothetical protein Lepto7375DRAFT_1355 [Leptolyngbya sp. PCC 7375]|nr:hypothetical protein Lepto7375DRAFT_1355 [Leptolyngbya sp. PCC 7375]
MVQPDERQLEEMPLSQGKLALRDATLVANELVLDTATLSPRLHVDKQASQPSSYTVEIFWDEALVTATELLYGETVHPIQNIDSLQIVKLHRRRSVIQKKLSNFAAGIIATIGVVLVIGSLPWLVHVFGMLLFISSLGYAVYFNWWIEQRRRGEFGLVMTMQTEAKVVITSHSLKAIQTLYQILFRRLDQVNLNDESLMVNMYTGETLHKGTAQK